MKINQITAFMLGNSKHAPKKGDKWCPFDTEMWMCADIESAKKILKQSQTNTLEPCPIWTTIYRVNAQNIQCTKIEHNLIWTTQPTKIIVDGPVFYCAPTDVDDLALLKNARIVAAYISKINNTAHKNGGKTK